MIDPVIQPVVIGVLVILEVAVWQVRVALSTRGRKRVAAGLGAVNAVLSVVAISQVVTNLDRPANIAGYAVGVAIGVYLGVVVDGRFAGDPVEYRIVLSGDGSGLAGELTEQGWPVTRHAVHGPAGPATVVSVVTRPRRAADLDRALESLAPGGFRTTSRLSSVR